MSLSPEWRFTKEPVSYTDACALMEQRVEKVFQGQEAELLWFLQHPSLYSIGTSGHERDVLQNPQKIPVYPTGRGGQVTYHGPGQLVGYVMLDLKKRSLSPKEFVYGVGSWIIAVLAGLKIDAWMVPDRIGVWVRLGEQEKKIASIGVRIRKGISFHGFALNVSPDLIFFHQIVSCGLSQFQATSLEEMGVSSSPAELFLWFKELFPFS
ncbi:MAG: lipoyl(octanoyl) transferase LipB [Holosporales bacterium]|nr:lipoyl(octanoyl) transferase LipB [Holosporales bacterium]